MLYKYDKSSLNYKKVTGTWLIAMLLVLLASIALTGFVTVNKLNDVRFISEETKAIILREADKQNEFSPEKLKAYVLELNIKYPHIVMAQAQLETGAFKSAIFKENHNLFGLKQATKRPTTNKGTENGHAYYESWRESVVDYAFYQATYLKDIRTEDEYLQYLGANYAEDPNYVVKIKKIAYNLNVDK